MGVHLEDPQLPGRSKSWDVSTSSPKTQVKYHEFLHIHVTAHCIFPRPKRMTDSVGSSRSSSYGQDSGSGGTDSQNNSMTRMSKSESPDPPGSGLENLNLHGNKSETQIDKQSGNSNKSNGSKSDSFFWRLGRKKSLESRQNSGPLTPTLSESPDPRSPTGQVKFSFGSDSDEDKEGARGRKNPTSPRSPDDQVLSSKGGSKETRRGRFRKLIKPLRRSQSAGCTKDVPAHALFLRHELDSSKSKPDRHSFVGRDPMDRQISVESADSVDGDSSKDKKKKSSLGKNVKSKLAFLRRRHTDTALASRDMKGGPISQETAISWSKAFETLLQDKHGLELFRDFLRTEFSEENLEFWIACERFKSLKSNQMQSQAQRIYGDFVIVQAPHEINLDSKTRMITQKNLSNPDKNTFIQAQKRIQGLMEKDSYPRFLRSDNYQDLIGDHKLDLS